MPKKEKPINKKYQKNKPVIKEMLDTKYHGWPISMLKINEITVFKSF